MISSADIQAFWTDKGNGPIYQYPSTNKFPEGPTTSKLENPLQSAPNLIDSILEERGKRYGKFVDHAQVTQNLKDTIHDALNGHNKYLTADQQEALDMICHKIGRIVNGDPDYADSWDDIAGYAKLVGDRLRGIIK